MSTNNDQSKTVDDQENVSKETLMDLLKVKGKEIKTISAKLSKIEEKYVKIFKEHKNLSKDREILINFIQDVYKDFQPSFEQKIGSVDQQQLFELNKKREDNEKQIFQTEMDKYLKQKIELDKKIENMLDQQKQDLQNNPQIKNLQKQLSEQEKVFNSLSKEIVELNDMIQDKNKLIQKLKKIEQEFSIQKAEKLLKDLNVKNTENTFDIKQKIQQSEDKNFIIKLKNQLEISNQKISDLQVQIDSKHTKSHIILTPVQESSTQTYIDPGTYNSQTHICQKCLSLSQDKQLQDILNLKNNINKNVSNKIVDQEYLKNVILKYFMYTESRNYKESGILMNVIMTILKMGEDEKKLIEEARDKGSYWHSAKQIINEGLCGGNGYVDVNYEKNNNNQIQHDINDKMLKK